MTKIKKGFIKKKEMVKSSFIFTTMPSFKQVESNCSKKKPCKRGCSWIIKSSHCLNFGYHKYSIIFSIQTQNGCTGCTHKEKKLWSKQLLILFKKKSSFHFHIFSRFRFPFKCRKEIFQWSRKLKTQGLPESWWRVISKLVNLCLVKTFSLISTPALGAISVNFFHAKYWMIFVLLGPLVATYSSDLEQKKHLISSVELAVKWLLNRPFCLPSTLFHLVGPYPEYWGSVQY